MLLFCRCKWTNYSYDHCSGWAALDPHNLPTLPCRNRYNDKDRTWHDRLHLRNYNSTVGVIIKILHIDLYYLSNV